MAAKGLYINPTTFVPLNQISENLTTEIATRNFAMGGYTGFFNYLPDPDPILRRLGKDQAVYKDLLADDQVGPLFQRRKNLTKSLDWFIARNDAGDKEVELCELTLNTFEGFGCKTKDLISQTLNPIGFGYSVFEIVYQVINGNFIPAVIWEKPREWFVFDSENRLRLRTIDNWEGIIVNGKDADPKVAIKFILLQNDPSYENPYGDKALSRCFWPVTFKRGGTKFFSNFVERFGMPFIYGKLPRGAGKEEHDDLFNQLLNFISGAIGTGPDDSSIQLIEPKGTASADVFDRYLQRCDNAISKALLLNALSTDVQKSGARASSETGAVTIEGDIAQTDQDFPTTFFNEIFKRVIDLNLGTGKYPTFCVKELTDAKKEFAERDKYISESANVSGQQIKRTKNYYINQFGYNVDEFEIKDLSAPQPVKPMYPLSQLPENGQTETTAFSKFWNKLTGKRIELANNKSFAEQVTDVLPEKYLQFGIEQTLAPVLELAKNSTGRDQFINGLASLYPKMITTDLEELASKILFIAEIEGRLADNKKE